MIHGPTTRGSGGGGGGGIGVYVSWEAVAAEGRPNLLHASKNRDMDGALALGGHHLVATHNNQLGVGGRSGSDVGEEARGCQSV